jgi:hypothetical protein
MASYTEGLLRNQLREIKDWASVNTSRLNAEKLRLPNSESYNQSFMKLETRNANITTNVVILGAANRVRQEWKLRMPQEDFNSAALADLVQSEELLTQIKEFREDLRRLKAIAKHQERVDKMVMSRLERLRIKPSSVRISENSLQKMGGLYQCRSLRKMLLLVQASRRRRIPRLRSGFTFGR